MRRLFVVLLVLLMAAGALTYGWLNRPLELAGTQALELEIEPGTPPRAVAQSVVRAGARVSPGLLFWWFRLSGQARQIRAGNYEIPPGTTPRTLLRKLVRGEEALRSVTLPEGWTFRQWRAQLARAEQLRSQSADMSDAQIMAALGQPGLAPEGRFFPDTYTYARGSSDLAVLARALHAMQRRLAAAWDARDPATPLKSADEALVLASIIEKETGRAEERAEIAGVFVNRLRAGMLLQTDPSVIYGLGEKFDGNLRKRDLQTDTPWNTYTRTGLPPTPISMPGKAALLAAVQPAPTKALYFVARGDGSSHFSATLDEHNRAVNRYQRAGQ